VIGAFIGINAIIPGISEFQEIFYNYIYIADVTYTLNGKAAV
jgi:hypothetical protein